MRISFFKRLTASYFFVVVVTLACAAIPLLPLLKATYLRHLEQSLATQVRLLAKTLPQDPQALTEWSKSEAGLTGCRITVIGADGTVQADSEKSRDEVLLMDNHATRPEVQAALAQGQGQSLRHSRTLRQDMLYVALPLSQGKGVLRLALPLTEVQQRLFSFQKNLLMAGAVAFLVALIVAWITMRKISEPLRSVLSLVGSGPGDDLGRLAKTYNEMTRRIETKVRDLALERRQQNAILSALVESILAVDHQGRLLFLNPSARSLFNLPAEGLTGRPLVEVLRHRPLTELVEQALLGKPTPSREITLHTPQERIVSLQAVSVNYGEGQTGAVVALHDVTELRKLEGVRREFVANVSHELKTPLTSIKGYAETLLEGALKDPKNSHDFTKIILDHANNLSRLIDDVLDLSAIEAERVSYLLEPVAPAESIERILKALTPMAKAKNVSLHVDLPKTLPKVLADREKLVQIFMNLLENAVKFNKSGGEVWVSAAAHDDRLSIRIRDTGRGIAPDDLPRIFERFYRGNKDRSHEIPGTGLGLAIVKHLVEAHKGDITVKSTLNEGTIFELSLPLAQDLLSQKSV